MTRDEMIEAVEALVCERDRRIALGWKVENPSAFAAVVVDAIHLDKYEQVGAGSHPWLVVDTWGEKRPIGCWQEAAAKALIPSISTPLERGRYVVIPAAALEPAPTEGGE